MDNRSVRKSMSWSFISEIAAKLILPISNMILARILDPSAFGVVAICNMLVSFVDLISDAGFAKYLIQRDFESEKEKDDYSNVSFWTNISVSVFLVLLIVVFRNNIAGILGSKSYSTVISIASLQLIVTSFSSIQTALFRRNFDFKTLFYARIAVAISPIIITVPLALLFRSYWAMVIGNLTGALVNTLVLSRFSKWKPKFYYNKIYLKKMFSYSFWSLAEALANWTIFWVDTFVIGSFFTEYQLGLYKNSSSMVMALVGMISTAMSPVLLTTLSRLKNNLKEYIDSYININAFILYLIMPVTVGLFLYRELATIILFGDRWSNASDIVGAWSLMMFFSVIFYSFPAELYKSKGIPKVLFIFQLCYLFFLIPLLLIASKVGFWQVVYARTFSVIIQVILSIIFMRLYFNLNLKKYVAIFIRPSIATVSIVVIYFILHNKLVGLTGGLLSIFISIIVYLLILLIFFKSKIYELIKFIK